MCRAICPQTSLFILAELAVFTLFCLYGVHRRKPASRRFLFAQLGQASLRLGSALGTPVCC